MEEIIYFTDSQTLPPYIVQNDYLLNLKRQFIEKYQQKYTVNTANFKNSLKKKNTKPQILKGIISRFKTDRLVKNFCKKIKRIIPNRKPFQFQLNKQSSNLFDSIENKEGIQISDFYQIISIIVGIIFTATLTVFFSLKLVFSQIQQSDNMKTFQKFALIFFSVDMLMKFISKNNYGGKTLIYLSEISRHYLTHNFMLDLINIFLIVQQIFFYSSLVVVNLIHLLVIIKLIRLVIDLEIFLEKIFITNFKRQQITNLIAVILTNFSFAHILSILLNSMIFLNTENNWITQHNLEFRPWYEKYAWGYYWGSTIMFTVGFGDFAATNFQQAICITLIQMFSCIILTYNINCVGNIINNLRLNSVMKMKRLKTFYQMNKNKAISSQLEKKILNYIEGQSLIKKSFNFSDQNQLLQSLSTNLKIQYLKESQKSLFENLPQIKNWTNYVKSLLAQKIKKLVSHPQSIIQQKGELAKLIILEKGQIGLMFNQRGTKKNQYKIQTIISDSLEKAKLTTLDFIKNKKLNYQIKSLTYSILYYFQNQDLISILRESALDFQNFCYLRDRQQYLLNQNQIIKCQLCVDQYHTKFKCPKVHYIPIKNHVMYRYNYLKKSFIQKRIPVQRKRPKLKYKKITREQKQYLAGFASQNAFDTQQIYQQFLSQKQSQQKITMKNIPRISQIESNKKIRSIQQFLTNFMKSNLEENFWDVECDEMFNWKYYFYEYNPINLSKKIKLKLKKK